LDVGQHAEDPERRTVDEIIVLIRFVTVEKAA
jgi:hypothetical protein